MKNKLLFIAILSLNLSVLFAQKPRFSVENDKKTNFPIKINYFDSTGRLLNSFNIIENNPYNKLEYPILKKDKYGLIIYDMTKVSKSEAVKALSPKYIEQKSSFKKSDSDLNTPSLTSLKSRVVYSGEFRDDSFRIVSYSLMAYEHDEYPISFKSNIFVLNNKGNIIANLPDINTETNLPKITNDGGYIVFTYGGELTCSNDELQPHSFKILDVKTKEILWDEPFTKIDTSLKIKYEQGSDYPTCIEDNLIVMVSSTYSDGKEIYLYKIYNPVERVVYLRESENFIRTYEIKKDGFHLKNGTFYSFKTDFIKSE